MRLVVYIKLKVMISLNEIEDAVLRLTPAELDAFRAWFAEFDSAALLLHAGRNFAGAAQMLRHYIAQEELSEDGPAFQARYLLGAVLEKQGKKKEAAAEFQAPPR